MSGSTLLFRKFKASLGISERRNYSSSFKDEDKLGTICWCNWHSSFSSFKQNLWPFKYLYLLIFQGDLLNLKIILMFGLYVYKAKTPVWDSTLRSGHKEALGHLSLCCIQKSLFSNATLSFIVTIPWPASLIATEEGMVTESKCPEFQDIKGQKDTGAEERKMQKGKTVLWGTHDHRWSVLNCCLFPSLCIDALSHLHFCGYCACNM